MKNIKLTIGICLWAILWFMVGLSTSKGDMMIDSITSPAYHFMPQNLYHNTIYGNTSSKYTINKTCSQRVDRIEVYKRDKRMILIDDTDCVVKEYKVRVGLNKGPKHCDGDKKTPEGTYYITEKRDSKYYKFLALNYPNNNDIANAKRLGCKPGDSIGIHAWIKGLPKEGSLGCITVWTKDEILEINRLVKVGTKVIIND